MTMTTVFTDRPSAKGAPADRRPSARRVPGHPPKVPEVRGTPFGDAPELQCRRAVRAAVGLPGRGATHPPYAFIILKAKRGV